MQDMKEDISMLRSIAKGILNKKAGVQSSKKRS